MIMKYLSIALTFFLFQGIGFSQMSFNYPADNPTELGKVNWLRNYEEALAEAKTRKLPVLILFQEVPGCANCTRYGNGALSDPLLVEAIETYFVPLCIYNNKKGEDERILKLYGEPSWNNPVVRLVNQEGKNIGSRLANDLSTEALLNKIVNAMEQSNQTVPEYLSLYHTELNAKENLKTANLSMFCFWTGEKEIAKIPGVIATEAGFMHGREVVKVDYDESSLSLPDLVEKAGALKCANEVYLDRDYDIAELRRHTDGTKVRASGDFQSDTEVKYYLSKSPYRFLPMSPLQQAKVNSALGDQQKFDQFLSPRQLELFAKINSGQLKAKKSCVNSDMSGHWAILMNKIK